MVCNKNRNGKIYWQAKNKASKDSDKESIPGTWDHYEYETVEGIT